MLRILFRNESGAVLYDSSLPFELDFGATGLREIVQNLAVLFMTPIRSQMLDRTLGLDMSFIDKPIPVAQNMLVSEISEKVQEFEDRVDIKDVEWLPSSPEAGHLAAAFTLAFNL